MPGWTWRTGHSSHRAECRREGSKCDARLVGRSCRGERDSQNQPRWNRLGIGDGAWSKHGSCHAHRSDSRGPDGMRGDRVGVGDVGQVPRRTCITRHTACGDDGGGARSKCQPDLVCRCNMCRHDAKIQPSGHGISIDDGTRLEHGVVDVHGAGERGADGMHGDGVVFRDISEVPGGTRVSGHSGCCDNCKRTGCELHTRLVSGCGGAEYDT